MFIELTDHLRCPADHEEAYLVLLPSRMAGRRVVDGSLGCPVCGRMVEVRDGVVAFGGGVPATGETGLTPEGAQALLGISGPGGYLALAGAATSLVPGLAGLLPGVHLVALNPVPGSPADSPASVLRGARMSLKTSSMRGVILGADLTSARDWVEDAARAVLPGLRVVGEGGDAADLPALELLAAAGGCWVGRKR